MMLSVFKPELTHQPREPWDIAVPIDFNDLDSIANLIHHIDGVFGSMKEVSRPLGMDDTGQAGRWSDVASCQMPRAPPTYPTRTVGAGKMQQPLSGSVDYIRLFAWITEKLA
jgi:hypothetical protein